MTDLLSNLVVVDLTRALAGPHAAMMLGDLGARVIKVESPTGDDSRGWGPPFVGPEEDQRSTYFMSANRNKESVTADLRSDEGSEFLRRLVAQADVLLENFRPGVLDRLGFSVDELHAINPRLVILSITGFGHDGPEGGRAGYDQIAQGEAGLMSLTGEPGGEPMKVGVPIGDLLAGMYGAYGVLAALLERERTGRGAGGADQPAVVDRRRARLSRHPMDAGAVRCPASIGNHHPSIAPYGLFETADAPVQIACGSEGLWRAFAPLGRSRPWRRALRHQLQARAQPRGAQRPDQRPARRARCRALAAAARRGRSPGWQGAHASTTSTRWDQTRSQGLLIEVDDPGRGSDRAAGPTDPVRRPSASRAGVTCTTRRRDSASTTLSVRAWLDELRG